LYKGRFYKGDSIDFDGKMTITRHVPRDWASTSRIRREFQLTDSQLTRESTAKFGARKVKKVLTLGPEGSNRGSILPPTKTGEKTGKQDIPEGLPQ